MPANPASLTIEQRYRDRLLARALQTAIAINARFALIDRSDLTRSFQNLVPELAAMIRLGQRDAQVLAQVFLASHFEAERAARLALRPMSSGIAGTTIDGRPIAQLVSGFIPSVFIALRRGVSLDTALNIGRHAVWRAAITEITEAAHRETAYQGEGDNPMTGWTWVTGGSSPCGACLAQEDGRTRPWSRPMGRHAGCSCIEAPVYANDPGTVARPTGMDKFNDMTVEQQNDTFRTAGETKAQLLRDGQIELSDLVKVEQHDAWRDSITEKSLSELGVLEDTNTEPRR